MPRRLGSLATYADWFGIRPESMIGKHFSECFGEASYMSRKPSLDGALRTGQRLSHEREAERGGRRRHLRSTYVPDVASDGSVVGLYELTMGISESKAVETQLTQLARVDHMTGRPNRLQYEDKLRQALARSRRTGRALALLYIDIDCFKTINDTQGHAAGDTVLKEFAGRLKGSVRITDTVARLGGDEFVVVLEQLRNKEEAELVASKVAAAMQAPIMLARGTVAATAKALAWVCFKAPTKPRPRASSWPTPTQRYTTPSTRVETRFGSVPALNSITVRPPHHDSDRHVAHRSLRNAMLRSVRGRTREQADKV